MIHFLPLYPTKVIMVSAVRPCQENAPENWRIVAFETGT
jgi:hypothetical protein